MKKPNLILLFILCSLVLVRGQATPQNSPAPPSPSATSNTTGVPLTVTPAAEFNRPSQLNLARWYTGAAIVVVQPDGTPKRLSFMERDKSPFGALLGEDSTAPAPIGPGPTRVVIDLGRPLVINHLRLYSFTATGTLDIYYSSTALPPTSTSWKLTNVRVSLSRDTPVSAELQPVDARYVMLAFNPTAAGTIGSLAIYGVNTIKPGSASAPVQPGVNGEPVAANPSNRAVDFDFGPSAFGSRVTHVSGGNASTAQNALDGDPKTAVTLGDAPGQDNIMVIDLGAVREVDKLSLLMGGSGPGTLEFYMLDSLPDSLKNSSSSAAPAKAALVLRRDGSPLYLAATSGSLAEALALAQLAQTDGVSTAYLPPDFFTTHKPSFAKALDGGEERINEQFDKLPCKYLIIRWVPKNASSPSINVFEVNLIGPVPEEAFAAASATYASAAATSTSGSGSSGTGTGGGSTPVAPPGGGLGPGPPPPVSP
jgi:hypothetical protein